MCDIKLYLLVLGSFLHFEVQSCGNNNFSFFNGNSIYIMQILYQLIFCLSDIVSI